MIIVEDVDFQTMCLTQQTRGQATTEQSTPPTRPGLADQHQTGTALGGVLDQGFRDFTGA